MWNNQTLKKGREGDINKSLYWLKRNIAYKGQGKFDNRRPPAKYLRKENKRSGISDQYLIP